MSEIKKMKDIKFPTEPYIGWTYEFQNYYKGWVCIDEEEEE